MKQEKRPFLTIGIPTWNRRDFLQRLLNNLISEINSCNFKDLEILISDNDSEDGTQELVLSKYVNKYDYIRYIKNFNNLKAKGNIINVIKKSSGNYLWLMGDDDLIVENKMSQVIELIKKHQNKIFLLNTVDKKGGLKLYGKLSKGIYQFKTNSNLMKKNITSMGLISNLILPVKKAKEIINEFEEFSPIWPHLHIAILMSIKENCNFYLYNYIITNNNQNKNLVYRGIDNIRLFVEGYFEMIKLIEFQTQRNLGSLKFSSLEVMRFISNYISSSFSGDYTKDVKYMVRLNKKIKNMKLIILSTPFLAPPILRRFIFYLICMFTNNLKLYKSYKKEYTSYPDEKSARTVTAKGNIF